MPELPTPAPPLQPSIDAVSWGLRVILALVFLYEGFDKFGSRQLWIRLFAEIGIGQWFRYATGMVEVVGAVLLMIPPATTIAVTMLACTMVGALLAHIFIIGVGPQSVVVSLLFVAAMAIGWRRRTALKSVGAPSLTS